MKKDLIIILFFFNVFGLANNNRGNIDSLYNALLHLRGISSERTANYSIADTAHYKCGFELISHIKFNYQSFSASQKKVIDQILQRPVTDTSIVSPGGFFRIHYFLSGASAPKYNINDFALALDSAYNFEVNYLGYPPPPADNGEGGDNKYDVYIESLGNVYGDTVPENEISPGSNTYTSYMEVDNGFVGFYTTGIDAARVTVAHEFHHAIQMGNYILRRNDDGSIIDDFFYELTSTAMEEFVFDSVNDYYNYLPSYFYYPEISFSNHAGYDLAIWNIFLQKRYGYNIIKRQWELLRQYRALQSIDMSLVEVTSSFQQEYGEFGEWTYFTNYRAIPNKYFQEALNYPLIHIISDVTFTPPGSSVSLQDIYPTSNNFVRFVNNLDTLCVVISNADIQNLSLIHSVQYGLYNSPVSNSHKLSNNYYSVFTPDVSDFWNVKEILNNQDIPVAISYVYPSPFSYKKSSFIFIPVGNSTASVVNFNVYNIAMTLVYSSTMKITYDGKGNSGIQWYGKNLKDEKLATGVYIYVIKSGNNISKGKLVILNE
jgi:hypothetical protein